MLRFKESYTIYISEIVDAGNRGIGRSGLINKEVALIEVMIELAEDYYDFLWSNTFREVGTDLIEDNGFF